MNRLAVLAVAGALAGCSASSVLYDLPIAAAYDPGMLRAFDGEIPLLAGGMDEAQAEALSAAMAGWHRRIELAFPVNGDTEASYGYRVVARLEGKRMRVQDACRPDAAMRFDEGDQSRHLGLAFCRGKRLTTGVTTRLADGTSIGDAAFADQVDDMMLLLFPRRNPRNDRDLRERLEILQ